MDGNQTLLKTTTGIWHVTYNAENRPIIFSNETTKVEMAYDYMGRRFEYKETVNNTLARHERYLYRGYLQIAALDMLNSASVKHTIAWDPSERVATRPLVFTIPTAYSLQPTASYYYSFDQVKNVTELFDSTGALAAVYDYSPFGQITSALSVGSSAFSVASNPITFSSEVFDSALGLQYYNYRHLNVLDGRWVNRDPIEETGGANIYTLILNNGMMYVDYRGLRIKDNIEYIGELSSKGFIERYYKSKLRYPDPRANGAAEVFIRGYARSYSCGLPDHICNKVKVAKDTVVEGQIFWIGYPDNNDSCETAEHEYDHIRHGMESAEYFDGILHAVANEKCVKLRCAARSVDYINQSKDYATALMDLKDAILDYDDYGKNLKGWGDHLINKMMKCFDEELKLKEAKRKMDDACSCGN